MSYRLWSLCHKFQNVYHITNGCVVLVCSLATLYLNSYDNKATLNLAQREREAGRAQGAHRHINPFSQPQTNTPSDNWTFPADAFVQSDVQYRYIFPSAAAAACVCSLGFKPRVLMLLASRSPISSIRVEKGGLHSRVLMMLTLMLMISC